MAFDGTSAAHTTLTAIRRRWQRPVELFTLAAGLLAALLAVPVVAVALNLFVPGTGIMDHLVQTVLPGTILNTVALAILVGLGVTATGTGAAWLVVMCRFPGRRILEVALLLPLAAPGYVLAYAYADLLDSAGPVQETLRSLTGWRTGDYWFPAIRSLPGAAFVLTVALYPYVYMLARAAFLEQSACAIEVARSLGRGPWTAFLQVALPLARPAIAGGVALALMETLADYGTVAFYGVPVFTTMIYRTWFSHGDPVAAAQLAAGLVSLVALLIAAERVSRGRQRFANTSRRMRPLAPYVLDGPRAFAAAGLCALPALLGFGLPALSLLMMAPGETSLADTRLLRAAISSVTLAAIVAALAIAAALVFAYAQRSSRHPLAGLAAQTAGLGYAVPGSVIAVGTLLPFAALDNGIDAWMRAQFGVSTGLILTGSLAALVFACLVRFTGVALQSAQAGLTRVTPAMDDAARVLGRPVLERLALVHGPLIAPSLLTGALMVFVDTLKELPATLMMRPFGFETLATRAHALASDERLAAAAVPSLGIVAAGLVPIIVLMRAMRRTGS